MVVVPPKSPLAVTIREAIDVIRRVEPTAFRAVWAGPVSDLALEQRLRRLERRGVITPVRKGEGRLDTWLLDGLAVVSACLYLRLVTAGVKISTAAALVNRYQDAIREAIETGAAICAWWDSLGAGAAVFGMTEQEKVNRIPPLSRECVSVRIPLQTLIADVKREIAAVRRKEPNVWANGKPQPVRALMGTR